MTRTYLFMGLVGIWLVSWVFVSWNAYAGSCTECHQDPDWRIKNRKLYDYYHQWEGSIHDEAGVVCSDCHGGDPEATQKEAAHGMHIDPADRESPVHYQNLATTCGGCHQAVYQNFVASTHYRKLKQDDAAPHCGTCHGAMNAQVEHQFINPICDTCHDGQALPDVTPQARRILHQLKVAKAYLGWTHLYYAEKGEPHKMDRLQRQFTQIADAWHQFKLDTTEEESKELLIELQGVLKKARAEQGAN